MSKKQSIRTGKFSREAILSFIMLIFCLAMMFPVFYALITSLRPPGTGLVGGFFPSELYWGNYQRLFNYGKFPRYVLNSLIDAVGGALLTCLVASLAGYSLGRFKFRGKNLFLAFVMATMMLPAITNLIPLYKIASDLKILNTYFVMIVIFGAYGIPLSIWIMKGFFESIPLVLEEAAAIDGATPLQTFIKIVLPISAPGLLATLLINFVYNWNNFIMPLFMLTKSDMKTATVGLFDFQHALEGNQDELLAAATVVIMVPAILLFISLRKYFLQGMVEGAVKG